MNKERLDSISRVMSVLRAMDKGKGSWPCADADYDGRTEKWPHEIAYDLFIEAEGKLEEALIVLSKGEVR